MAGLLDQLSGLLTPENMNAIAGATGIDADTLQQGLSVAGPLLQGGLANNASSGASLDSLTSLLGSVGGGGKDDPLAGIMGMLNGDGAAGGTDIIGALGPMLGSAMGSGGGGLSGMLGGLLGGSGGGAAAASDPVSGFVNMALGDGNSAIAKYIDGSLGFKITPYLAMAAPFVMGLLKKDAKDRNLDAHGMADMVKSGNDEFMAKGGPTADLLRAANDAGAQAVALKNKFTPGEWKSVAAGPLAAAAAIIYASPSSSGADKEVSAALGAIDEIVEAASPTSMFTTLYADVGPDALKKFGPDVPKATLMDEIKAGMSAVNSVNPAESGPYKKLVLDVAQHTAEATKSGGFLGFGGKKISDAEAAVLGELNSLLSA